jgi:putative ATP-dependent endonuclease of OLD family
MPNAVNFKMTGLGISSYRSFDKSGVFIPNLKKVNVLIGRNNCGKSNVLRFLMELALKGSENKLFHSKADCHREEEALPLVTCMFSLRSLLSQHADHKWIREDILGADAKDKDIELRCTYGLKDSVGTKFTGLENIGYQKLFNIIDLLFPGNSLRGQSEKNVLLGVQKGFCQKAGFAVSETFRKLIYIPHFRKATTAGIGKAEKKKFHLDGTEIIAELGHMQHPPLHEEHLQKTFNETQEFIRELLDVPELELEILHDKSNMYLRMHHLRRPLEDFGTGVHELVILCSTLAMHTDHVFCIEEPELHLHPSLQRKFFRFLERTDNTYYITTHSNVFLDTPNNASIYHVSYDGMKSSIQRADTSPTACHLLDDLGYLASDILQSNGIVWVEGPSDKTLINQWLALMYGGKFVEGVHYTILYYGGKLLSHYSGAHDCSPDVLVPMLRINRNAFVVMDRDRLNKAGDVNETKRRIEAEVTAERCWITQGREIENYLSGETVKRFLKVNHGKDVQVVVNPEESLSQTILNTLTAAEEEPFKYSDDKVKWARQLSPHITRTDLGVLDLQIRLEQLGKAVSAWNVVQLASPKGDEA